MSSCALSAFPTCGFPLRTVGMLCFRCPLSSVAWSVSSTSRAYTGKDAPYVGYGHQLQKGERFTAAMTERQADSLLRADLMKRLMMFKDYGKDALLLAVLSYNVGAGRLLGYGKHSKSRLLRKIESGDRNFYREFISFCRYKGKVLSGLVKRRKVEFALFYIP